MPIRERKNKSGKVYEVRFTYKNKYGITKNYSKSGFKTKKEAKNHESYIKEQIRLGCLIDSTITLNEVFEEHIKYDTSLALSTKQMRTVYYNKHIKHRIGNAQIGLIDFRIIQDIFNDLAKEYSKSTNENILRLLNSLFKFAFNCGYINKLPYAKITVKGKLQPKKEKIMSLEDFEEMIQYLETCKKSDSLRFKSYRIAVYIGHYTGMRLGEVCSLDKSDIDFKNKLINVDKNIFVDIKTNELIIKDTKTNTSSTTIPLPYQLEIILRDWFEENTSDHVVVDDDLNYLNPKLIKGFMLNYSRKAGKRITFHMLRHTYTTLLWKNDVDPKTAQTLLRHKDFNTTMSIYTHLDNENLNSVVDNVFKN